MGLFSTKKTYVSSVLYNLAGDIEDRVDYLKTTLIGHQIFDAGGSVGESVRNSYLRGPGLKMRSFFRWAELNYGAIGVPSGFLGGAFNIDRAAIGAEIPADAGKTIQVQVADAGRGDYSYWSEQWMFLNYPELVDTFWSSDIDDTTGVIRVTFEDMTYEDFVPTDFSIDEAYLYVTYFQSGAGYEDDPVVGDVVVMDPADPFPSVTGWSMLTETTTDESGNTRIIQVWEKTEYMGQDPDPTVDEIYNLKSTLTLDQLQDSEAVVLERSHQTTTQRIVLSDNGSARMFIYKLGSGNAVLDGLVAAEANEGEYIPFIPIRLDNKFLSDTYEPEAYALAKKAYKKATGGGKFDKLIENIADNEDLDEVDYAYVMYGVSLNMSDPTGKQYLYRYFDRLRTSQTNDNLEYLLWRDNKFDYDDATAEYTAWKEAQTSPLDPLYGTAAPALPGLAASLGTKPTNNVKIKSNGTLNTNVDMTITWQSIERTEGTGLKKPDAKKGDYWLEQGGEILTGNTTINGVGGTVINVVRGGDDIFRIHHQIDDDNWETLTVIGAEHENLIYKKKSVITTSKEALDDADESSFLIPLHFDTLRDMSLKDSTQLCTGCGYVVFNCYKVVKKKWYQTGLFKLVLFIVVIAITVVSAGAAAPSVGLLGSAAAVGAAIGLTGLVAVIAGAVINALAAMLLMKLIMMGSVALFGEKLGALIGTIVGFIAITTGTALMNGSSASAMWSSMMSAQNLMQLTSVIASGVTGYVQASAMETYQKAADMEKDAEKERKELNEKFAAEFGYGSALIDPVSFVEAMQQTSWESSDSFLTRTLLTGTDIAEMSIDMLNNFSEYTLSLKKV